MSDAGTPPLRALLIGIDRYLPPRDRLIPRYHQLYGSVRDVERMARWLRRGLGVPEERIHRLVAPHGERPPPAERRREWPCYEGMVAALERLIDAARPGEHLWIHYSGHGGRAPTLVPEIKRPLGLDECLVPWDVGDRAARYLRDVELAVLLERIERADAFATVVIDCCHSGGTTREGTRVRGIDAIDRTPRSMESLVLPLARREPRTDGTSARSTASRDRRRRRGWTSPWRHTQLAGGRVFDPTGYVLLAACRPGERAVEEPGDDGISGGTFTRSLLRVLGAMERGASYSQLLEAACHDVHSRHPGQTPLIEGEGQRPLLGGREPPQCRGVAVLGEGRTPGTVRLATGLAHGVAAGARFAIEPPAAPGVGSRPAGKTVVEVTAVGAVISEARAVERAGAERPEPGDRAIPLLSSPGDHDERWVRLARLENHAPGAFLRGRLTASLERLPDGWQAGDPVDGLPFDAGTGIPEIEAGDWVVLRVVNEAPEELNVAVLDLRSDRSVAQVFPTWRGGWYQPVDAGRDVRIPLRGWLPDGMISATDVLLVLATTGPMSHRWLEMPPAEIAGRGFPDALEPSEAGHAAIEAAPSTARPLDDGPHGWITARATLKVVQSPLRSRRP